MKPIVLLALESIITDHVSEQDGRQDLLIAVRKAAALEAQNAKLREHLEFMTLVVENNQQRIGYHPNSNVDRWTKSSRALLTEAK
jgi:sensor domain CHASE-containing protein